MVRVAVSTPSTVHSPPASGVCDETQNVSLAGNEPATTHLGPRGMVELALLLGEAEDDGRSLVGDSWAGGPDEPTVTGGPRPEPGSLSQPVATPAIVAPRTTTASESKVIATP